MSDQLSGNLQENLLVLLCFSDTAAPFLVNALDPGLFENSVYKSIAIQAIDFYVEFKTTPKDHISDLLESKLDDPKTERVYANTLISLFENQDSINEVYVLSQVTKFIDEQRLKVAVVEAAHAIKVGNIEEAKSVLSKASKDEIVTFAPGVFFADTSQSLKFLSEELDPFPTGIKPLDEMKFGPAPGELLVILAPPNRGKCIGENERVLLSDGRYLPIKDIIKQKLSNSVSLDETLGVFVNSTISDFYANGKKDCVKITTRMGRECIVSKTHPFLSPNGWLNVLDFKEGDFIGVPRNLPMQGTISVEKELSSLLAYMIAEGCMVHGTCSFTNISLDIKEDFVHCAEYFGARIRTHDSLTDVCCNPEMWRMKNFKNPIVNLMKHFGIYNHLSKDKFIPEQVFTWDEKSIANFLNKLFTCDGSLYLEYDSYPCVEYGCASERLVDDINHLMLRFGIVGKISRNHKKGVFKWSTRNKEHVLGFIKQIGLSSYKKDICDKALIAIESYSRSTRNTYKDLVPYNLIDKMIEEYGRDSFNAFAKEKLQEYKKGFRKGINFQTLNEIVRQHPNLNLDKYVLKDVYWDNVVSIEEVGEVETYDLTIPKTHNFIASDMLVHNTFAMIHVGKTCVRHGLKVMHISLEMSEEKMSRRYIQAMFSFSTSKEEGQIAKFELDEMNRFASIDFKNVTRPVIDYRTDSKKIIMDKMKKFQGRWRLYIKRFPTNGLTIKGLEAYLDGMERFHNFVPDVVLLDYADLMQIGSTNVRIDTGNIYKELRRIAVERNLAMVTASQTNRLAEDAKVITIKHLAEDYTKAATADNIIAYCQTPQEQKIGLARLFIAKARDEERDQSVLISQSYRFGQFCTDATLMHDGRYWKEIDIHSAPDMNEPEDKKPKYQRRPMKSDK